MRYIIFLLLAFATMQAFRLKEPISVSGTITDLKGIPLNGVTVMVKGTRTSTLTNQDGMFTIILPDQKSILVIQYVGYESLEIRPGSRKKLSITLKTSGESLQEVVVTAHGKPHHKKDLTANDALSGKAAGVDIYGNSAQPQYKQSPYPSTRNSQYEYNREGYDRITENFFRKVADEPLSTFSIDVDGASYSNVRRFINNNALPPDGAVRVEEMINYFQYGYAQPKNGDPFAIHTEMGVCPWNEKHRLVMIGLQGRKVQMETLPASNLTFLIDVSGSMQSPDKLPLVKSSLRLLTEQLREEDMVSIVVYGPVPQKYS